jgi:hypothetical protein
VVPDEAIYLLTKTKRNGYHQELFTAYRYRHDLRDLVTGGHFGPLTWCRYVSQTTDAERPGIALSTSAEDSERCTITWHDDAFVLDVPTRLREGDDPVTASPEGLVDALIDLGERWSAT